MSDDAPATCPFRGLMERVGLSSPREHGKEAPSAPGACPFSSSMAKAAPSLSPPTSTGGGCPLGFGRSKPGGPPLTALHCPRCKSLFHECVVLDPCGHRFCGSCFGEGLTDCLVCGRDVASRSRDDGSQRAADAALEDAAGADGEGPAQAWLRAAMSSAAGGNHAAALSRSQRAEEELKKEGSASAARLAAVSGVIGDSHRCLGDAGAAARRYEGAIAVLEEALGSGAPPPSERREVTRALTVTLNKLGDLLYSSSEGEARALYARSLRARLEAAGVSEVEAEELREGGGKEPINIEPAGEGDAERASDLIDAGLSAAKVADADASAGKEREAEGGIRLAGALLKAGAAAASAGGPLAARAERLRRYLEGPRGDERG